MEKIDSDSLPNESKLVAVVYMLTYNQENFIEQAVESVMNQETDFNYKLVIGEDYSTDKTREICLLLKEKYPHKIDLILNETNLGIINNTKNILRSSLGNSAGYIALIEGDDYWTDPLKLQKQVDFLRTNPDYSIVFHKVKEIDASGKQINILNSPDSEANYNIHDLAAGNFIHTASVVFRKNFDELPSWIEYSVVGDYPLHMMNAQYGLIKYFPEEMAVYRTGNGIWSSQSRTYQLMNTMFTLKLLTKHFTERADVTSILLQQYNSLIEEFQKNNTKNIICYVPEKIASHFSYKGLVYIMLKKIRNTIRHYTGK